MIRNSRHIQPGAAGYLHTRRFSSLSRWFAASTSAVILIGAMSTGCSESAAQRERRRAAPEPTPRERRLEVATRSDTDRPRSTTTSRRSSTPPRNSTSRARINPTPSSYSESAPTTTERRSALRPVEPTRRTPVESPRRPVSDPGSVASANDSYVPPPPPPAGSEPSIRVYHVQKGDTLWSLASRFYGDSKHWRRILAANRNRVPDPRNLPVGIKLIIP